MADLLGISNEMLTTVMVLIKQHNLTRELQRDYAWIVSLENVILLRAHIAAHKAKVLFYGVSTAGVLAAELKRCAQNGLSLPGSLSRSELIRNLSVLISYLEWVTRPGDGNHAACSEASKMLARILDDALVLQSNVEQPRQPVLEPSKNGAVLTLEDDNMMLNQDDCDTLPVDSEAFLEWFDSVDWNNPMGC